MDLDAECCGMAGSFGYIIGHYDVSVAMAERRLLPASELPGTAAMHPAFLIRDMLTD